MAHGGASHLPKQQTPHSTHASEEAGYGRENCTVSRAPSESLAGVSGEAPFTPGVTEGRRRRSIIRAALRDGPRPVPDAPARDPVFLGASLTAGRDSNDAHRERTTISSADVPNRVARGRTSPAADADGTPQSAPFPKKRRGARWGLRPGRTRQPPHSAPLPKKRATARRKSPCHVRHPGVSRPGAAPFTPTIAPRRGRRSILRSLPPALPTPVRARRPRPRSGLLRCLPRRGSTPGRRS